MSRIPRIGLTMRLELETGRFYLGRDYCEALEHFGSVPLHIGLIPEKNYVYECLKNLDGILLPGSDSDIDPLRYYEEPHARLGCVVTEKDQTDQLVLSAAEELNLPVFAICYGMQALNVSRGGSLFQDIESQVENSFKHLQGKPLKRNSHSIIINESGILPGISKKFNDTNEISVNSHHHQSVKIIGENLRCTAKAKDGVIECIEDTRADRFVVGVQWHPELSWKEDRVSNQLFKVFVEKCRQQTPLR